MQNGFATNKILSVDKSMISYFSWNAVLHEIEIKINRFRNLLKLLLKCKLFPAMVSYV
jgi:hypothetical protein